MPLTEPIFEIKGFRGKKNTGDPARTLPSESSSFLREALNLDIDDELMAHRRGGSQPASYSAPQIHSLWSNGKICLFVQGADLKRLNTDFSASTIRSEAGTARVSYVDVNGVVYLTNGTLIGYVKDGAFSFFDDPGQTYKVTMKPGHLIEYYNGRLYVARDNVVWYSDPMAPGRTDERRNFIQLSSRITLFSAVDDGIYTADLGSTYFLGGADPKEFKLVQLGDYGAIPGTAQKANAENIDGIEGGGMAVLWLSPMGVCAGGNGGQFKNLTKEHYRISGSFQGAAVIHKLKGYCQYLISISGPEKAEIVSEPLIVSGTMQAEIP